MPQIFHPSMNTVSRATIFGAMFILALLGWLILTVAHSPYLTAVGVIKPQPVPFSHQHHVAQCGIDCRYCHTSVEDSTFAGIPPTQTCMNCHSQIWNDSPMLEPVRASFRDDRPLVWNRVHDLPDFAYFDHSIHIKRGVACTTCHGELAEMPLTWKSATLYMEWCLECHRNPAPSMGRPEQVFASAKQGLDPAIAAITLGQTTPEDLNAVRQKTVSAQFVGPSGGPLIANCSVCHR